MIQEYLFKTEEDKEKINRLSYENVQKNIYTFKNEGLWIVTFELIGENEKTAATLSKIHEHIVEKFNPTVLRNGCSSYYNKLLFPHFNEFERKLRKLLYLKSALNANEKDAGTISELEKKDLGQLFALLFTDSAFVQGVKRTIGEKTWLFTKIEIINALQNITEDALWDRLIGQEAVPLLRSKFIEIRNFRNDVMHAHDMTVSSYHNAMKLIKEVNKQLDMEIEKVLGARDVDRTHESKTREDFNFALNNAIKNMDAIASIRSWQTNLSLMAETMESMIKPVNIPMIDPEVLKYISSPEFMTLQQNAQKIANLQIPVMPALVDFAELQRAMAQYTQLKPIISPVTVDFSSKAEGEKVGNPSKGLSEDLFATSGGTQK